MERDGGGVSVILTGRTVQTIMAQLDGLEPDMVSLGCSVLGRVTALATIGNETVKAQCWQRPPIVGWLMRAIRRPTLVHSMTIDREGRRW